MAPKDEKIINKDNSAQHLFGVMGNSGNTNFFLKEVIFPLHGLLVGHFLLEGEYLALQLSVIVTQAANFLKVVIGVEKGGIFNEEGMPNRADDANSGIPQRSAPLDREDVGDNDQE